MSSIKEDDPVLDTNETAFTQAKEFQQLGSYLSADGIVDTPVRGSIRWAWLKWRRTPGILCDRMKVPSLQDLTEKSLHRSSLYG
ncbi:hypothetical protein Y032_0007g3435 [Ancylostoma ceylanicum]|uniref:Uncharacterized protein n=1 Tax=Ancylostoma ceylanicum TaxID=53326 RepID=A0A016VPU6_9BILA|nr:hypothetical protein Y032_0007g3435 [Ancylostoma ceylanicum]